MVMTYAFLHTLTHVTTNRINSESTIIRATSKEHSPHQGLNAWDSPAFSELKKPLGEKPLQA